MTNNNSTYKRLGDYIREVDVRNTDELLSEDDLYGVSVTKEFITTHANLVGVRFNNYKVVNHGQFTYISDTSRRGEKIALAYNYWGKDIIVSSVYTVFEITDYNKLLPEYLMMWFRRAEFDRYARFHSHGSAREVFDWEEMCNVMLPVPSIEEQQRIVDRYNAIKNRIDVQTRLIASLQEAAQALYRKMFVDGIDIENLPEGWRMGTLGEVCEYYNVKIDTSSLSNETYISTENILKDKKGITTIDSVPEGRCNEFKRNMILLSNIRPYFKKLWKANFDGGCSADVLCFVVKDGISPDFLYCTMAEDSFFDYVVSGCNGVKMPRGDKNWTLKYPILIPKSDCLLEFQGKTKRIDSYCNGLNKENEKLTEMLSLLMVGMGR